MRFRPKLVSALVVLAVACALGVVTPALGQETTGGLQGIVTMKSDRSPLPGVSVEAVHVPTGTHYTATTQVSGRFNILNVRVGGPYTVTVKLSGFKEQTLKGIEVALGERRNLGFELDLEGIQQAVEVTAETMPLISPDRMGSGSALSEAQIKVLPTVRRQFQDLARANPLFNMAPYDDSGTVMSVAGKNNRYNTIQIDGAVNNDLFGLSSSGTPGGLTDVQPISLDAIQELQLVVSPYDVKQGGFTGGAINAITRSGSNDFHGSVYGSTRNQNYIGNGPYDKPYTKFSEDQLGLRVGGPILSDKLFFFASGERNRRSAPDGTSADSSTATTFNNPADAERFRNALINYYNYDPGSFGDISKKTDSNLAFVRFDFNVSPSHNATLRYNYLDAGRDQVSDRSTTKFRFPSSIYTITDKTNSAVLQVNSVFGSSSFNQGRVGYQTIVDARSVPTTFPGVYIGASGASNTVDSFSMVAGTERYSAANSLDQKILEITDDFTLVKGSHTITIGTHNEFFNFENLYLGDLYGSYGFRTVADFDRPNPIAADYWVKFATGNDPRRPTTFGAQQWGLYVGDQWRVTNNLTVNVGIRGDLPRLPDTPSFNQKIFDALGINTSDVPSGDVMISPRLGFNWSPGAVGKDQVRGGVGVFAGRTPFVWISNVYGNTGIETVALSAKNVPFNPDPLNPPKNFPPGTSAVSVDGIDPNFKFPRVLRANLAYDRELPGGIRGTVEGMYTETLQDVFYFNMNYVPTGGTAFDGRPTYKKANTGIADVAYLTNTNKGNQTNLTVQLDKRFQFGLAVNASYSYMDARSTFDATSSQAYSNWKYYPNRGDIYTPELSRSNYEVRDRFNLVVSQALRTGPLNHNVAFIYIVQSGQPYSVMMGGDPNKDGASGNDLLYVPKSADDIVLKGATVDQYEAFLRWTGLDAQQGEVSKRNSLFAPWNRTLDFHYDLEVPIGSFRPQFTLDILNLVNLIDHSRGVQQYVSNQTYTPLNYVGQDATTGKPIYQTAFNGSLDPGKAFNVQDLRSRYQLKFGVRVSF